MKLGTRSLIAISAAVLAAGTLLGANAPAAVTSPACQPDHCDTLVQYYSHQVFRQAP